MGTHSSLSLRPRLVRLVPPPSTLSIFSPLLAAIARRSCSSSSYAASRLFMVERLFAFAACIALALALDVGRGFLLVLLGDLVPSFENEAALLVLRERCWYNGR